MSRHILVLNVKRKYFEQIRRGEKKEEYRLFSMFWMKRIAYRADELRGIEIRCGYPKPDDKKRILTFPWRGYEVREITHPEFGSDPVQVLAIKLEAQG